MYRENTSDSDDEENKLVQKALYVEPRSNRFNVNTTPTNGSEFIHKAKLEDASLQFSLDNNIIGTSGPKKSVKQWGRKQAKEFSLYAMKLKSDRQVLGEKFPKIVETPEEGEKEWCTFCLGSELCSAIYGPENSCEGVEKGYLPFLSIVLHLSRREVKLLLTYHHQWFQIIGMEDAIGMWFYALLACLEKPVNYKYLKVLETFYDDCQKNLEICEDTKKCRVFLISSVLKHYFCVKSYKVGSPLYRFVK